MEWHITQEDPNLYNLEGIGGKFLVCPSRGPHSPADLIGKTTHSRDTFPVGRQASISVHYQRTPGGLLWQPIRSRLYRL